jgi:hypothetical protein
MKVAAVMSYPVRTAWKENAKIARPARLMAEYRIGFLPVAPRAMGRGEK